MISTHTPAEATIRQPSVYPDISPSQTFTEFLRLPGRCCKTYVKHWWRQGKVIQASTCTWYGPAGLSSCSFLRYWWNIFVLIIYNHFFFLSGYTLGVQTFFAFFSSCQYLKYFKPWQKYDTSPLNYYLYCNLLLLVLTQCLHDSFPELSNCLKPRELHLKEDITYSFHISYCWQNLVVCKYVYTLIHIVHNSMNNKSTNTIKV